MRSPIGLAVVRCKLLTGPHVGAGQRHLHVENKRHSRHSRHSRHRRALPHAPAAATALEATARPTLSHGYSLRGELGPLGTTALGQYSSHPSLSAHTVFELYTFFKVKICHLSVSEE